MKIHEYVDVFKKYNFSQLSITLLFSFFRYLVFSLQYYIILKAVGMDDFTLINGLRIISVIFLLNTLRPSIALLEIGIRGSVALFVFGLYVGFNSQYDTEILAASSFIWLINIILPALVGIIFVKDLKFFKTKKK